MILKAKNLYNLPKNWKWYKIVDISEIRSGYGFPIKYQGKIEGDLPFFKVKDISNAFKKGYKYLERADNYISFEESKELKTKPLNKNSIVFAKIGEALKLDRRTILKQNSLVDNNVMGIYVNPNSVNYLYFYYFFLTIKLEKLCRATTVPSVRKTDVEEIFVPLPPLPIQNQIVEKIEELFTKIEYSINLLKNLKANLSLYQQSILKFAFEGKLSKEWRELNKDHMESASNLIEQVKIIRKSKNIKFKQKQLTESSELYNLPEKWQWAKLEEFSLNPKQDIVDGPFGSNLKASEYKDEGIPIIRLQNVKANKFLNKNIKYISKAKANELKRHNYKSGDIVLTKLGRPLGESCIVPNYLKWGIIVADIVRVNIIEDLFLKEYVNYAINSNFSKNELNSNVKGTTRPRVNLGHIRGLMIPIAPKLEQHEIVKELNREFSILKSLKKNINILLKKATKLKKSILKSAFEGNLTKRFEIQKTLNKKNNKLNNPKIDKNVESKQKSLKDYV